MINRWKNITSEENSRLYAWMTATALCAILALWGWQIYPIPTGGAVDVLPPAIEIAQGKAFVNPLARDLQGGPAEDKRFVQYPPLFPLILGYSMPKADPQWMFLIIGLMNGASLCLLTALLIERKYSYKLILIVLLATATTFTYHRSGRPETLATLIFMVAWWAATHLRGGRRFAALGACIGAMAATHLAGLLLCLCLLWVVESLNHRPLIAAKRLSIVIAIGAIVFWMIMQLSPYDIGETLVAAFRHTVYPIAFPQPFRVRMYYVFQPQAPLFGAVLMVAAAVAAALLVQWGREIPSRMGIWTGCCLLVLIDSYLAVHSNNRNFHLLIFSPLFFAVLAEAWKVRLGGRAGRWIITCVLIAATSGILRLGALYIVYLRRGVSVSEGRDRFEALARGKRTNAMIGITSGLWVLSEDYEHMYLWEPGVPETYLVSNSSLRFLQQNNYSLRPGTEMDGYQLKANYYTSDLPRLGILQLARTVPGYSFAVYAAEDQPSSHHEITPHAP